VSPVGRRIDDSSPMVDARLPDGSRVNAIIKPLALDGPHLSIRKFRRDALSSDDLIRYESANDAMVELLRGIVKSRLNVIISGGTGAGKTTLLNILSSFIPPTERIVTIEDSAELQLRQPHVVRLETRPANIEGSGEVAQRLLLINALRMRPDRIIMGEVRGGEAVDMLQAMNTGHDGSLTTIHANSPARRAEPPRDHDRDGEPRPAREGDAAADRQRRQRGGAGEPPGRRHPQAACRSPRSSGWKAT
jgi:pilus assembly protein CpaF